MGQSAEEELAAAFNDVFAPAPRDEEPPIPGFDERKYLRAYPDVAAAVRAGQIESGRMHYLRYGQAEQRLARLTYKHGWPVVDSEKFPAHGIDAVLRTSSGQALVIGWVNDTEPLESLSLILHETLLGATDAIARCRRRDAEAVVGAAEGRLLGFWTVFTVRADTPTEDIRAVLMTGSGQRAIEVAVQSVSDERLREVALEYLATASYWGNAQVEAFGFLDGALGQSLIGLNRAISARIAAGAFCRRFGPQRARFAGSIIVCLYGRVEYLFLQAALFTIGTGWRDYEFIYVSNSPELTERLMKEAELAARIYDVSISLVVLPGNAGFGVANNVAAGFARSARLVFTNPDVFPRREDWAQAHRAVVENAPAAQTRLFGAPLYYDDGSLMHAGMYFNLDEGFSVQPDGVRQRELARVEHYGKGAPPDSRKFLTPRSVPAVTGALISADRDWFERLEGFSPDYVFGHYEDADLCLRSLLAGTQVWLHAVPFWHMEGKGSSRRAVHDGGSLINRWHFTQSWAAILHDGLLGPAPARLAEAAR